MARWEDIPEYEREYLANMRLPTFETTPCVSGPPLSRRRIALITTAGIERRTDKPYPFFSGEFRVIPGDVDHGELVMSHLSPNFDRVGFQQDINVVFPLDRMKELERRGVVGSVGRFHYSFMGGSAPEDMEPFIDELVRLLKDDEVDSVLMCPV